MSIQIRKRERSRRQGLSTLTPVHAPHALSPIPEYMPPEVREFAETLRTLFGALGISLNRLAALMHYVPGTVSRYLSSVAGHSG